MIRILTSVKNTSSAIVRSLHSSLSPARVIALIGTLTTALVSSGGAPLAYRAAVATTTTVVLSSCRVPESCRSFSGSCTGFGGRQSVVAPISINPDANTIEQSCTGAFQYPWVEVCEGQAPRRGCGVCLF